MPDLPQHSHGGVGVGRQAGRAVYEADRNLPVLERPS
jgi:hypothetical protein